MEKEDFFKEGKEQTGLSAFRFEMSTSEGDYKSGEVGRYKTVFDDFGEVIAFYDNDNSIRFTIELYDNLARIKIGEHGFQEKNPRRSVMDFLRTGYIVSADIERNGNISLNVSSQSIDEDNAEQSITYTEVRKIYRVESVPEAINKISRTFPIIEQDAINRLNAYLQIRKENPFMFPGGLSLKEYFEPRHGKVSSKIYADQIAVYEKLIRDLIKKQGWFTYLTDSYEEEKRGRQVFKDAKREIDNIAREIEEHKKKREKASSDLQKLLTDENTANENYKANYNRLLNLIRGYFDILSPESTSISIGQMIFFEQLAQRMAVHYLIGSESDPYKIAAFWKTEKIPDKYILDIPISSVRDALYLTINALKRYSAPGRLSKRTFFHRRRVKSIIEGYVGERSLSFGETNFNISSDGNFIIVKSDKYSGAAKIDNWKYKIPLKLISDIVNMKGRRSNDGQISKWISLLSDSFQEK